MSKKLQALIIIVVCVFTLSVLATTGLSLMTYFKVNALSASDTKANDTDEGEDDTNDFSVEGEDDIEIGGGYRILSTTAISDAYLSGDSSALSDRDKETLAMASEVLDEIITDGMDDYEKEKAVFLWMNEKINSGEDTTVLVNDDNSGGDPHSVLRSRSAVCVGYATTFRLFMHMMEIPCKVVHDTYLTHSWDLVQIGGSWYHVDLYSANGLDDPLVYLNLNDEMQLQSGFDWDQMNYPAADSLDKCYAYMNAVKTSDVYSLPEEIKKAIDGRKSYASFLFPDDDRNYSLADSLLYTLEDKLMYSEEYGNRLSMSHTVTVTDSSEILVCVQLMYYDDYEYESYDSDLSDEEQKKIDTAITDSFGELTETSW